MSVEIRHINCGLLCKYYGFTLNEARALDDIERDVFTRYMNMVNRIQTKKMKSKSGKGGGGYGED